MMNHDAFTREKEFMVASAILNTLHQDSLLTDEEYSAAKRLLVEKYQPVVGKIIVDTA